MVSQVTLDAMHLVDLGVMKKMMEIIVGRHCVGEPRTVSELESMNIRFKGMAVFTPSAYQRRPRAIIIELCRFKATELRQLCTPCTGIVLFHEFLDPPAYNHFLRCLLSYRILYSKEHQGPVHINWAEKMLTRFVQEFAHFYGEDNRGYNIHNLLHLSEECRRHGPLPAYSAYEFKVTLEH